MNLKNSFQTLLAHFIEMYWSEFSLKNSFQTKKPIIAAIAYTMSRPLCSDHRDLMCEISYLCDIHYNLHFNLWEVCIDISVRKFENTKMKDLEKKVV